VLKGKEHPNYKNGNETREARAERKRVLAELNQYATILGVNQRKRLN
jgi:hypothetical protein